MPNSRPPGSDVILVVDDDAVSLRLASEMLRKAFPDHRILACDGDGALGLVDTHLPALVVTDLYMPGTSGLQIIQVLRDKRPDLPVVVMTSRGSERTAVDALRAGAASYVAKQRMAEDLVETVGWVMASKSRARRHEEVFDHMALLERRFVLPNRSELITPLVSEFQNDLRRLAVCPEEDLVRFGVALTEALMNAMIHGNLALPGRLVEEAGGLHAFRKLVEERLRCAPYCDRRVFVELRADRKQAVCRIRDEGDGFDPGVLPDPTDPEMVLRQHGRGLLLIRTFMDDVSFNEQGNEITMVKRGLPDSGEGL